MISRCYGSSDSPNTKVLLKTKILNCALTNGHIFWNMKPTWMCLKPDVFLMVSRGRLGGLSHSVRKHKTSASSLLKLSWWVAEENLIFPHDVEFRTIQNDNCTSYISLTFTVSTSLFFIQSIKPVWNEWGLYPIKIQRFSSYRCRRCHSNSIKI